MSRAPRIAPDKMEIEKKGAATPAIEGPKDDVSVSRAAVSRATRRALSPRPLKKMSRFSSTFSLSYLLDSQLIGLHRVFRQQAAGAAVGEGVGRLREGGGEESLLLPLRQRRWLLLDLSPRRCEQQREERHEPRPKPLSAALSRRKRRRRSSQQDLGEGRRRAAALESSRGRGRKHIFWFFSRVSLAFSRVATL